MSENQKYIALPDLDPAPEIYETPDLTDDSSTLASTNALRSESPNPSYHDQVDHETNGIDRHRIDADEARTRFLPSSDREHISLDRLRSKRRAYRSSSRGQQTKALEINGVQLSTSDDQESRERRFARLRKELAEIKADYEGRFADTKDDANEVSQKETGPIDSLTDMLESVRTAAGERKLNAAFRLTRRLASTPRSVQESAQPHVSETAGVDPTHTVTYAPTYREQQLLSKVTDFDNRLTLIEAALGVDTIILPTQNRSPTKAVIPTLDSLDKQLTILSSSTDTSLETVSRRVRRLTKDAEMLAQARKNAKAAQDACSPGGVRPNPASANGGLTENDAIEDHEHTSKINALYGTLNTIESLAPLLPSVLNRLRSLRALHSDAATASQSLTNIESRQEAMSEELQGWRESLEKVEQAMQHGEQTMMSNTDMVDTWVKELEERMQKLSQ